MTTMPSPAEEMGSLILDYMAEEVRAVVARRRTKQREIGKLLRISQGQVSARLNGHVGFGLDEIVLLAAYFDMPAGELLQSAADRIPPAEFQRVVNRDLRLEAGNAEDPGPHEEDRGQSYGIRDSNPEPADSAHVVATVAQMAVVTSLTSARRDRSRTEETAARLPGNPRPAEPRTTPTPEVTVAKVIDLRRYPRDAAATVTPGLPALPQTLAVVLLHPTAQTERSA